MQAKKIKLERRKQRQCAMNGIYEMDMKKDYSIIDRIFITDRLISTNEKIDKDTKTNNKDHISKLLSENSGPDFCVQDFFDNDGIIEYEVDNIYLYNENTIDNYENTEYFTKIINEYVKNREIIEEKIKEILLDEWNINRLSKVDLAILKIAITDIEYMNTPYAVAINEAVELSKKYCDEKSPKFVNGVLKQYVNLFVTKE